MSLEVVAVLGEPQARVTLSEFQMAIRDGRGFSAGTGLRTVYENRSLNQIFTNPTGSGKNAFVVLRAFYNDRIAGEEPLELRFIPSPVQPAGAIAVTPSNLKTGGITSVMEFWTELGDEPINRDPPIEKPIAFILPTGGEPFKIETLRLVGPGESFGFYIKGEDVNPDKASINFVWYEEDV